MEAGIGKHSLGQPPPPQQLSHHQDPTEQIRGAHTPHTPQRGTGWPSCLGLGNQEGRLKYCPGQGQGQSPASLCLLPGRSPAVTKATFSWDLGCWTLTPRRMHEEGTYAVFRVMDHSDYPSVWFLATLASPHWRGQGQKSVDARCHQVHPGGSS